jgi:hypothetical protein
MLLPGFDRAVIDINKLTGYVLNPLHLEGKHKARVFLSALGITQADAHWLYASIIARLPHGTAVLVGVNAWGSLYHVDMNLTRDGRCARVRTGWICTPDETRMTTCFVIGGCDEAA